MRMKLANGMGKVNPLTYLASCAESMETNPPPFPYLNENEPYPIPKSPDANGLLCLKGNLGLWIQINSPPHLLVKHLMLVFSGMEDDEDLGA